MTKTTQAKISLLAIAAIVVVLAVVMSGYLAIVSPFEFAGFMWIDSGDFSQACSYGSFSGSVAQSGEFVDINGNGANDYGKRSIETDIAGVDEILVIYEGFGSASCSNGYPNSGANIYSSIIGSVNGDLRQEKNVVTSRCPSGGDSVSTTFPPSIWKFRNNFDGTWSSLQSLGVGDVFIVQGTKTIAGNPKLKLGVEAGGGCASQTSADIHLKAYNIVRKEDAFALCKADKYAYDLNKDGKIAVDGSECVALSTIVLNSEEAIKESFDEKLLRVQQELQAKNDGLTAQIISLQSQLSSQQTGTQITLLQQQIQQLESQLASASDKTTIQVQIDALRQEQLQSGSLQDQLNALQAELKETKSVLAGVQARDKNVINTIVYQEQFKSPNFIVEFFNKIIAFFKNLFK